MKQQTLSPHVADDSGRGAFGIPVKILRQGFVDRGRGLSLILSPSLASWTAIAVAATDG